jgi:predicted PhzF superfamily epimerase YddE/YHI9
MLTRRIGQQRAAAVNCRRRAAAVNCRAAARVNWIMELPIYQVDAFTSRTFSGNPAAVCPLREWLDPAVMQAIAAENNLAETAFFVPRDGRCDLRWFTPEVEVKLCGHATLATAYVLFENLGATGDELIFDTLSGELRVARVDGKLRLDFPALPPKRCEPHPRLIEALGTQPLEILKASYYLAVYPAPEDVLGLQPNLPLLGSLDNTPVIVTAPSSEVDFVSRFFAPSFGIDEDPVCGSAHCTLAPYWSRRLGKKQLHTLQVSKRGGELWLEDRGDRVWIAGHAAPYLKGCITVG